ncbi:NACHT domain-containing protein [Actinomadura sp. DC4]|uniref:NACHT domain-containing protein n=1 Tax=Actinomadura sp. DC4 TaxID=3055069 RepID=UPI0025B0B5A0|nr:NACHT domain-containing protein [Actinomadura sp. DC4]MDN3352035.1 NACHT domain-containing protein [Actinomadura sp. DC4]
MGFVDQIAVEVLADVIAATGRRIGVSASALRAGRSEDLAVARWFDTYRLTENLPGLPSDEALGALLQGDELQAAVHELLAARLTDAPEADLARVRDVFELTTGAPSVAGELFDYYDGEICTLVGRLSESGLLGQVRSEALSARIISVLHAIERHTAALRTRPGRETEASFLARYRRHLTEHHGQIDPPDFDRRRRVPIADLYVPPAVIGDSREIDLWTLDEEIDRTVLLGDPGAGKTTASNVLMNHHAEDAARRVPFLVTLRDLAAQDPPERSVAAYVEHRLEAFYQCPAPPGLVAHLLLSGRALVIFDGLDELVDPRRRVDVTTIIERFGTEYPLAPVLVTSRLVGYDQARLDDRHFRCHRIAAFTEEKVGEYVRKWFAQEREITSDEAERWAAAFMTESEAVPDLRANPLMLALMCILYRGEGSLPRNRAEVYERCAKLLFHKWDARRHIHVDLQAGHLLEPTLGHLAHWLFTRDEAQAAVPERELVDETARVLLEYGFEPEVQARAAAEEFVEFCRGRMWVFSDVGTTAAGEPLYAFTHRTFMEYFAASHLAYTSDTPEDLARLIAPHVERDAWEVVGELAVQIKARTTRLGADRVYTTLLDHPGGWGGSLLFLAGSLRSITPTPSTVRTLARQIFDRLAAGDMDDPEAYGPLVLLLHDGVAYREVVNEALRGKATRLVESADPAVRLTGLRLAVFFYNGSMPQSEFWEARRAENIQIYADAIVDAAERDGAMAKIAVDAGLLTTKEALEMPRGLFLAIERGPFGIYGQGWPSLAFIVASRSWEARDSITPVGRHILAHPDPPYVTENVEPWHTGPVDQAVGIKLRPDSVAYLGSGVCLLISSEAMAAMPDGRPEDLLGPFSALHPYIARRLGDTSVRELPELPIPGVFRRLFRDWADRKVDFVGQESSGGAAV